MSQNSLKLILGPADLSGYGFGGALHVFDIYLTLKWSLTCETAICKMCNLRAALKVTPSNKGIMSMPVATLRSVSLDDVPEVKHD